MLLLSALGAYLIGSIPFGLVLTRLAGLGDIRAIGSGNIGATNVLRTGNKWLAMATLALDFGKGFVAVVLLPESLFVPLMVVLGHMFPIWLRFKGGKGVACIFGLTYALSWQAGICISAAWLILFFATRTSSLGALIGIPIGMASAIIFGWFSMWPAMALPVLLMILKHRENITRLLKGEEHRFSFSKKERA